MWNVKMSYTYFRHAPNNLYYINNQNSRSIFHLFEKHFIFLRIVYYIRYMDDTTMKCII